MTTDKEIPTVVRFVGIEVPPYHTWKTENNVTWTEGLNTFLFEKLRKSVARYFRTEVILTHNGIMGMEVSPGNWSGAVGLLSRNEADLYAGYYSILPELNGIVDFTNPFDDCTFSVLSGPPKKVKNDPASVFSSVPFELWIILGICWLTVSLLFVALTRLEIKLEIIPPDANITLIESLLTFYGLLFQRGFDNLPKSMSRRLLASGWLILVIVLMTELAGTFSSKLAVQDVPERIDKVQDILKYPELRPYVSTGVATDDRISRSDNLEMQALWRQILRLNGSVGWAEFFEMAMLEEVSKGDAVAIGFTRELFDPMVREYCQQKINTFYKSKEHFFETAWAVMIRRGLHPYVRELLNQGISEFAQMGFQETIHRGLSANTAPCYAQVRSRISYAPFTFRDVIQILKILGLGYSISCLGLLVELVTFHSRGFLRRERGKPRSQFVQWVTF